jgi:hypothetical protein
MTELTILFWLFVLALYCAPLMLAGHRHHPQVNAIGILTILFGWTVIAWIIGLVWACTAIPAPQQSSTQSS